MPIAQAVDADLVRLLGRSRDPDFAAACEVIRGLMHEGGQARWLRAHMEAGSGMNDLARVASEMFER